MLFSIRRGRGKVVLKVSGWREEREKSGSGVNRSSELLICSIQQAMRDGHKIRYSCLLTPGSKAGTACTLAVVCEGHFGCNEAGKTWVRQVNAREETAGPRLEVQVKVRVCTFE